VGAVNNVEDDKDEPRWHGEAPYLRRARRILPQEDGKTRGRSGVYGGPEPQPQDAQVGGWTREQRERMDEKFRQAFERASFLPQRLSLD
jgi:hypothetical protein